jgi:uncharacterized protein
MSSAAVAALTVDVRELVGRPGAMLTRELRAPVTDEYAVSLARVSGDEIIVAVRLESVVDGILATAQIATESTTECARCLQQRTAELSTTASGLFLFPGAKIDESGEEELSDDLFHVEGDTINLDELVHDSVVLSLPARPLCRPDCPGLCPQCGVRLAEDPEHSHEQTDPRWSPLADLQTRLVRSPKQDQNATPADSGVVGTSRSSQSEPPAPGSR